MMESDSESGHKRPRGVHRSSLLQAVYHLTTRRLVVWLAVVMLIPTFTTLYYFQGSEYAVSGSGVGGVKANAKESQPTQHLTQVAGVESRPTDGPKNELVATTTMVIGTPKATPAATPAVEKEPASEQDDKDDEDDDVAEEQVNTPEEDNDEDEEEELQEDEHKDGGKPEQTVSVPESDDNGVPPPFETKQAVPAEHAQPTDAKYSDKPTEAEALAVETNTIQTGGHDSAKQPDEPIQTSEVVVPAEQPETPPEPHAGPKKLERRVIPLIAVDSPGPDLCKLMFSGMANGYPAPVLINWGNGGERMHAGVDKSHLYKIPKALEYLDLMMGESAHPDDKIHDDDLILLIDGYDIWWQLPPEVFISRFEAINRRANERLAAEWGSTENLPFRQTIVAGAQKRCTPAPEFGFNIHCNELPESPLRADLYGDKTDKEDERAWRPKNFNAGTIYGRAGDFRRFMRRALDRISRISSAVPDVRSDQGMWAEVWSEQEMFRNWLLKQPNRAETAFINDTAMRVMLDMFELHVGVDYYQELAIPTAFSEIDGAMLKFSNQSYIHTQSAMRGIHPVRLTGLPSDVLNADPPMQKFLPEEKTPGWNDLTLYADFFTETVPAILHHNAYANNLKERRVRWWDGTWYFPYLRRLGQKYMQKPASLPSLGGFNTGDEQIVYRALPSELNKRKPRRFTPEMVEKGLPEMEFDEVCREKPGDKAWFDEVFRDNLGPF